MPLTKSKRRTAKARQQKRWSPYQESAGKHENYGLPIQQHSSPTPAQEISSPIQPASSPTCTLPLLTSSPITHSSMYNIVQSSLFDVTSSDLSHTSNNSIDSSVTSSVALNFDHLRAITEVRETIDTLGFKFESLGIEASSLVSGCTPELQVVSPEGSTLPSISGFSTGRPKSWLLNYTVISFLMNGQLFSEYHRITNMLGLPHCSAKHWREIVGWLGEHVTNLAEWSCAQVLEEVHAQGDSEHWITSSDGYYLTRGHYSNNSSATLHDYSTGKIAYFRHRTKRGIGHNWEGTSGGAEADIFDDILKEASQAGFVIFEMVTDKDSSMNAIYCRHFPEGTITYCSNHNAKTMHKDLHKVTALKCKISVLFCTK